MSALGGDGLYPDPPDPQPMEKKFCKECGRMLITKSDSLGYNEYTGVAIRGPIRKVCPDQEKHDNLKIRRANWAKWRCNNG